MSLPSKDVLHYDMVQHKKHFSERKGSMETYFRLCRQYKEARKDGLILERLVKPMDCPICYDAITYQELDCFDCGHIFHFKCLEEWRTSAVKSGTTQHCPMCRCKGVTQKTLFNSHKKCSSEIPLSCIEEKYQVCLVERERRRYFRSLILCNQIITMMKQIE